MIWLGVFGLCYFCRCFYFVEEGFVCVVEIACGLCRYPPLLFFGFLGFQLLLFLDLLGLAFLVEDPADLGLVEPLLDRPVADHAFRRCFVPFVKYAFLLFVV